MAAMCFKQVQRFIVAKKKYFVARPLSNYKYYFAVNLDSIAQCQT